MSNKMTISSVDYLSDCVLEEGATVFVEDSGKVFRCIQGFGGQLTWEQESRSRYDFPETQLQLQEITFEAPRAHAGRLESQNGAKLKLRLKKAPMYLN